jgi:hypothetical protein
MSAVAASTHPDRIRLYLVAATLCLVASAGVRSLIPVLFGAPHAKAHITWRGVDEAGRRALEQRFRLSEPAPLADGQWAYVPLEPTPQLLRALITHPAVEKTDGIDRPALRMSPRAPLTARRGGLLPGVPMAARAARLTVYLLLGVGLMLLASACGHMAGVTPLAVLAMAARVRASPAAELRGMTVGARRWLERGIPVATPESAGAFRVVFVGLVLAFVASNPARHLALDTLGFAESVGLQRSLVSWLSTDAALVVTLDRVLVASGVLVIAGALTRVTYAVFVAAFYVWACVYTLDTTHHVVSALTLTLLCLLAAPWGEGWSVDAWVRRRRLRPTPQAGRRYGYVMWVPGLVYGVAMLAAVWSKVGSGPDWILNGTVKYHFVSDLQYAWVSWGPLLTSNRVVAVFLSAMAVAVEVSVIVASFTRSVRVRLALGAATLMLLCGFAVFQGIVWVGWWIPLISFLPWHLVRPPAPAADARTPGAATVPQLAMVGALVVQQLVVSASGLERRPMFSTYDMYSTTYPTPEAYEFSSNLEYRVVAVRQDASMDVPDCLLDEPAAARVRAATAPSRQVARELQIRGNVCLTGDDIEAVTLEGDRRVFDWDAGRFTVQRRLDVVGPIALPPSERSP